MKNHDRSKAVRTLEKKGVQISGLDVDVTKAKHLGNKSWGLIDFLRTDPAGKKSPIIGLSEYSKDSDLLRLLYRGLSHVQIEELILR